MSREGLSDFIHASEHSASLRRELAKCNNNESLIKLAHCYGFLITQEDLKREDELSKIEAWFRTSKISPYYRF